MKPVCIVGSHSETCGKTPTDENVDIWAFNKHAMYMPRADLTLQIHSKSGYECHGEEYVKWLFSHPNIMRDTYPFESVFSLTSHVKQGEYNEPEGLKLLTSTVDFALALAVLQNRPGISLYGIDLRGEKNEYRYQREGFMFWVGFAAGRGIPLDIRCADNIFKRPIYDGQKVVKDDTPK